MNKVELLAPAGSLNTLKVAIDAGADAVYVGCNAFNARMNAQNLTLDEIEEGCNYAHLRGSKVYLTLNTLVNSYEMEEALSLASDCYNLGIDGVLVQDIGLASMLHKYYPNIPLHASTQMNISNPMEFKSLMDLGFTRAVLPRELSLDEIVNYTSIAREYGIETEIFAHGAVCVCYSGLCLFSSMDKSGTRSGNRGQCAQPCRQEYIIEDSDLKKKGHLLSPKDRSILPYLRDVIDAGVTSIKIEGRMRDENYVSTVVFAYRTIIDSIYDGSYTNKSEKEVNNMLMVNFNRGGRFTSQYLGGVKKPDFLSGDFVGKFGLKIGNVTRCDKKSGSIEFSFDDKLPLPEKGDYLSIRDDNNELFSFPIGKVHEAPNRLSVKGLHPDSIATIKGNPDVYLMSHKFYDPKNTPVKKTHIQISFDATESGILQAEAITADNSVSTSVELDYSTNSEINPISSDRLISQMSKTGSTPFVVDSVEIIDNVLPSCSVSLINELRRELCDSLASDILFNCSHNTMREFIPEENAISETGISGNIKTLYYFPTIKNSVKNLRRDADIYAFSLYDLSYKIYKNEIINFIRNGNYEMALVLPDACHDETFEYVKKQINELKEQLGDLFSIIIDSGTLIDRHFYEENNLKHFVSFGANIYNSEAVNYASNSADAVSMSLELTSDEIIETLKNVNNKNTTIILHSGGPIQWMQSDFCPLGAHKNKCTECYAHNCATMKQVENSEKNLTIVSHPYDCSSSIYGPAKYSMDNLVAEEIADMGYNVIQMFSEI